MKRVTMMAKICERQEVRDNGRYESDPTNSSAASWTSRTVEGDAAALQRQQDQRWRDEGKQLLRRATSSTVVR